VAAVPSNSAPFLLAETGKANSGARDTYVGVPETNSHYFRIAVRSDKNSTATQNTGRGIKHVSDAQKRRDARASELQADDTEMICPGAASAGRLCQAGCSV